MNDRLAAFAQRARGVDVDEQDELLDQVGDASAVVNMAPEEAASLVAQFRHIVSTESIPIRHVLFRALVDQRTTQVKKARVHEATCLRAAELSIMEMRA